MSEKVEALALRLTLHLSAVFILRAEGSVTYIYYNGFQHENQPGRALAAFTTCQRPTSFPACLRCCPSDAAASLRANAWASLFVSTGRAPGAAAASPRSASWPAPLLCSACNTERWQSDTCARLPAVAHRRGSGGGGNSGARRGESRAVSTRYLAAADAPLPPKVSAPKPAAHYTNHFISFNAAL